MIAFLVSYFLLAYSYLFCYKKNSYILINSNDSSSPGNKLIS